MKKILLLLTFLGSFHAFFAQITFSANTSGDLQVLKKALLSNKGIPDKTLETHFPIYKINGNYFLSVLCKVTPSFTTDEAKQKGILFGSRIQDIVSLKLPLSNLEEALTVSGVSYLEIAQKVKPMLDKAVKDVRADSVQYGYGLPQSYTGKNVLIGITDWGFDYTHPMFYDTLMGQSRVLAAWDQYKTSGPAPSGFSYGTEYNTSLELQTAQSDTVNVYSYATHGSHVAGISGGAGAGTVYRGVGFDAQYLFTTFLVDNASVLDAYAWMYQKSLSEGKRLVINQSWGLYFMGTLDGHSLLSQALDNYSHMGVVFCVSAGNNGDVLFHIKHSFTGETIKSRISFNSYTSPTTMWGQSISMWGEVGNSFSAGLIVSNSSNVQQAQTPMYSTATTTSYIDSMMVVGQDTIFFNISADNSYPLNGRPQMRLRVKCVNTSLKIVLKSTATTGTVHYWNIAELTDDVGNWGLPFSSLGTGYLTGDANYGIGEPACANSVISVAAYSSEYHTTSGTLTGGTIASFSSFGPTLDERVKPDISAPGVNVGSSISSFTDNAYTLLTSVVFNGRTYPFARFSGTSMSGPMVTGVVTLILEANPQLSTEQVKQIIMETARIDNNTGVIPAGGSLRWGMGKINAYHAVQLALQTQGLGMNEISKSLPLLIYPNPTKDKLFIHSTVQIPASLELMTLDGKRTRLALQMDNSIDVSYLQSGMYFINVEINGNSGTFSFVKE